MEHIRDQSSSSQFWVDLPLGLTCHLDDSRRHRLSTTNHLAPDKRCQTLMNGWMNLKQITNRS